MAASDEVNRVEGKRRVEEDKREKRENLGEQLLQCTVQCCKLQQYISYVGKNFMTTSVD